MRKKSFIKKALCAGVSLSLFISCFFVKEAADVKADDYPSEILLGAFWESD